MSHSILSFRRCHCFALFLCAVAGLLAKPAGVVQAQNPQAQPTQNPQAQQAQATVMVPEQITSYRLVFETTYEEQKQVDYKPSWEPVVGTEPRLVARPLRGWDGNIYLQYVQESLTTTRWSYKMVPQETVANVPKVTAIWKPFTVTRLVPKQVPAGTPNPPDKLDEGNSAAIDPDPNGGNNDSGDNNGSLNTGELARIKDQLKKLQKENELLKKTLSETLAQSADSDSR